MDLMDKKAVWDRIGVDFVAHLRLIVAEWTPLAGFVQEHMIGNIFDKDLKEEFTDFGGLRIGYNGLGYIRVAELATTD